MNILNLLGGEAIKKQLFKKMAETAKENGFKQVLITIGEGGEFNAETLTDDFTVIKKTEKDFLLSFFEKNKTKNGVNYQDKVNTGKIDEIRNLDKVNILNNSVK